MDYAFLSFCIVLYLAILITVYFVALAMRRGK